MSAPHKLPAALLRELAVEVGGDPRTIARTAAGAIPKGLALQHRIKFSFERRGLGHLVAHLPPSPIRLIVGLGMPEQKP